MNTQKEIKLKKVLARHRPGTILLAKWLEGLGISRELQKQYRKSGWLESAGTGALKRPDDMVNWRGGLYTLQQQAKLPVHVGAATALSLQGYTHFLRFSAETVYLFSSPGTILPRWFHEYEWNQDIEHFSTSFLPDGLGLTELELNNFSITLSAPERAVLECLYLAPKRLDLMECYLLIEGMANLRPGLLQDLLEKCSSVYVKRLFLFMAEKAQHHWFGFLDRSKIDLGKGARSIVKGGRYNAQYRMVIPEDLM